MTNKYTYTQRVALQKARQIINEINPFSSQFEAEEALNKALTTITNEWPTISQMARRVKWLSPPEKKVVKIYGLLCFLQEGQAPKNTLSAIKTLLTK